ncbi:hypothetical protein, partial [Arcanobacterium phocae]|uniref:hypothetical protein n=1 Tax=Arcanobacterium phocae TaxID=131112 RepID=UPI001C114B3F
MELCVEGLPQAVRGVPVDIPAVGHVAEHAALVGRQQAVRAPADRTDVGVVEGVLVLGRRELRVAVPDGGIERRVAQVGVVIG